MTFIPIHLFCTAVYPVLRVIGVQDLSVNTGSHTWTATVTTIVNIAIIIKLLTIVVRRIRQIIRSGTEFFHQQQ